MPHGGKKSQVVKNKKDEHEDNTTTFFFYEDEHPLLKTKCTDPSVHQKEYGGWTTAGIKLYVTFQKSIAKVRKTDASKAWEAAVLELLHKEHGITKASYELQRKKEGKGKSKLPKGAVEEVVDLFADGEDDDSSVGPIAVV